MKDNIYAVVPEAGEYGLLRKIQDGECAGNERIWVDGNGGLWKYLFGAKERYSLEVCILNYRIMETSLQKIQKIAMGE